MTETAATRSVIVERELPHPPEKVWRALTQAALMEEWLMKNDFEPVVGHRFNLRSQPMPHWNGVTDCEVLVVEPYKRLSYSWNASGNENDPVSDMLFMAPSYLISLEPPSITKFWAVTQDASSEASQSAQ
jgi:uncharacterized protein YndB with AHSA1/START domain